MHAGHRLHRTDLSTSRTGINWSCDTGLHTRLIQPMRAQTRDGSPVAKTVGLLHVEPEPFMGLNNRHT